MPSALIVSDFHVEPLYSAIAGPSCRCRSSCSDPESLPRPYGQRGCDAPPALADAVLAAAPLLVPDASLILVLGDLVAHDLPVEALGNEIFANVSSQIGAAYPAPRPYCVMTIGNNDVQPDYASNISDPLYYAAQTAAVDAACGLLPSQLATLRGGGYYASEPAQHGVAGLRVVSLNTDIYSAKASRCAGGRSWPPAYV